MGKIESTQRHLEEFTAESKRGSPDMTRASEAGCGEIMGFIRRMRHWGREARELEQPQFRVEEEVRRA